ncbi:hypothetical protein ACQ4PT_042836 [Festuca glaucescens]
MELSAMPHITFFGNKLSGTDNLSDHDVFVCFMSVAIHCFLCPSSIEYPSGKYLAVLRQPEAVKEHDFSKLVYEHCLASINEFTIAGKLRGRRPRAPVCYNYILVVYYLDCLDFGSHNVVQSFPRIAVWRGNMIKVFSKLDRKRRHCFGKRHLKEGLASCRIQVIWLFFSMVLCTFVLFWALCSFHLFLLLIIFSAGHVLHVIDGILNVVDKCVSNKFATNKSRLEMLVNNVLDFLCQSNSISKPATTKRSKPQASNANKNVFLT